MKVPKWNCAFLPAPPTREHREARGFHARRRREVGVLMNAGSSQIRILAVDDHPIVRQGIDALIAIRNEFPDAKVIVLTTYIGDTQILRALKAGAQAYLLKNTLHKELLDTIRAVHAGKKTLSPEASFQVAEHATDDALTPAEILVLRMIAAGNANKQIADQLSITEETVKSRVKNILSKLGANDRTHAAMIGLKRGIIDL